MRLSRRAAAILFSNFVILGLGLIFLEVIFGNWVFPNRLNGLNLIRNTTVLFDIRHLYPNPSPAARYRRDAHGLRGEYRNPGSIDILTLGGSTTDQRYVTEGQTWQDVLRRDFEEHGKSVSVVNAGVDGQSTFGHLKDFERWFPYIPGLKAKYFLFYVGVNDFYKNAGYKFDALEQNQALTFRQMVRERSALDYLFRTVRGAYAGHVEKAETRSVNFEKLRWTDVPCVTDHETLMRPQLDAYEKRLRALAGKVRSWHAIPIFVTQTFYSHREVNGKIMGATETRTFDGVLINELDVYWMMRLLNQRTLSVCREEGGICIDLAGELEFDPVRDLYDFAHSTPEGSAKIGHYLYQKLKGYF